MKTLLLKVTILYSMENHFICCKRYGENYIPRIDTLLWHITGRSSAMKLQMKLMCQPTFGPY